MKNIIDLTQEIYNEMPVFPGHLKTHLWEDETHEETALRYTDGYSYCSNAMLISEHGPTHIDSHSHVNKNGLSIEKMPLDLFYGSALCLDMTWLPEHTLYSVEMIEEAEKRAGLTIDKGDIVLFHIGHYSKYHPSEKYLTGYSGFSYQAAKYLIETRGVKNWGVDTPSPDIAGTTNFPVHIHLKKIGIPHIENLCNLEKVSGKRFVFAGFPLRIRNGSGSPIRAVAIM